MFTKNKTERHAIEAVFIYCLHFINDIGLAIQL